MDRRSFLKVIGGGAPLVAGCGGRPATPTRGSVALPWRRLPGPQAGPVNDLHVSAADPNRIYAVTATAGHMYTADGGQRWFQGNEADHHGREIFASPHDAAVAYSQANRTDDGGRTWYRGSDGPERLRLPGNPQEEEVTDIAWDPFDPTVLYVCTGQAFYRSRDGGVTWEQRDIAGRKPPDEVFRVAAHPTIEGTLFVGFPDGAIYRSADRGTNWTPVNGQQSVTGTPVFFAVPADESGGVYVGTGSGQLLHLGDGAPADYLEDRSLISIRGNTSDAMSADGRRLYLLGEREADPEAWTLFRVDIESGAVSIVETPEPPVSVTTHPSDPDTVYLGGMSWISESQDRGETWERKADGFVERYVWAVGVNPDAPGTVLTGTVCQGGLFVSTDYGRTFAWKRSGIPPWHRQDAWGEHYVMDIAAGGNRAYVTTNAGILLSEDNGRTWRLLENEFSGSGDVVHGPEHDEDRETYDHLHGLGVDPADPLTVYVGTGRGGIGPAPDSFEGASMWRSRDGGETWREITTGFPSHLDTIVQEFLVSKHDSNRVYVGTKVGHVGMEGSELGDPAGMFRSTNAGDRWEPLSTPFENLHSIAEGAEDPDRLFVSCRQGVFRSDDGGESWEHVLQDQSKGLLTHPTERGVVFVGARTSDDYWDLLVSTDGGDTWRFADLTIQIGLEPTEREYDGIYRHAHYRGDKGQISSLALDRSDSRLYAAVRGSGLWGGDVGSIIESDG